MEGLKGCFLSIDWDIFFMDTDIDSTTESITAYISFCIDSVILLKTVKRYPNNKPYITKSIKECINRKRPAFKSGDKAGVQAAQKDLNVQMRHLGSNTGSRQNKICQNPTQRNCGTLSDK